MTKPKRRSRDSKAEREVAELRRIAKGMSAPALEAATFSDDEGRHIRISNVDNGVAIQITLMNVTDYAAGERQAVVVAYLVNELPAITAEILEHISECDADAHIFDPADRDA